MLGMLAADNSQLCPPSVISLSWSSFTYSLIYSVQASHIQWLVNTRAQEAKAWVSCLNLGHLWPVMSDHVVTVSQPKFSSCLVLLPLLPPSIALQNTDNKLLLNKYLKSLRFGILGIWEMASVGIRSYLRSRFWSWWPKIWQRRSHHSWWHTNISSRVVKKFSSGELGEDTSGRDCFGRCNLSSI